MPGQSVASICSTSIDLVFSTRLFESFPPLSFESFERATNSYRTFEDRARFDPWPDIFLPWRALPLKSFFQSFLHIVTFTT